MTRDQRKRNLIRTRLEENDLDRQDLRHLHSVLAICGLPYTRQPLDVREYESVQGRMSLVVKAGKLQTPDGRWERQPLPFGSRARLLLLHLCSEAIRQKSAIIDIEDSLTAFIRAMGFSVTGGKNGTLTSFKAQVNALAACHMHIGMWDGQRAKTVNTQPFSSIDVWFPASPDQRMLWPSSITFSHEFYSSLVTHALPVNVEAVRAFSGSPRKLDLLFWLGYFGSTRFENHWPSPGRLSKSSGAGGAVMIAISVMILQKRSIKFVRCFPNYRSVPQHAVAHSVQLGQRPSLSLQSR